MAVPKVATMEARRTRAVAAVVVVAVYVVSRNLFASMAGGVLAVFFMRMWLGA